MLLIRKRRPLWQAGKLNGVGGKIEPGESPCQAMSREFHEEAGLQLPPGDWQHALTLSAPTWAGHFFRTFSPELDDAVPLTDELLEIHPTRPLPPDTILNLQWMIPLLLDDDAVAAATYKVTIHPSHTTKSTTLLAARHPDR